MTKKINDELLEVECLEALFEMTNDVHYKDCLHDIIRQTGYAVIKSRYNQIKVSEEISLSIKENAQFLFDRLMSIHSESNIMLSDKK